MGTSATNAEPRRGEERPRPFSLSLEDLLQLPLFAELEPQLLVGLLKASSGEQYAKGSVIVHQSHAVERFWIVQRGLIDLAHTDGGRECSVLLLSSKDLLLPAAALFDELSLVSATTLVTTRLIGIDPAAVHCAMARSPALSSNLIKAMSGQWRMAVRTILDLNFRSAAQRIAAFLLRLADLQSPNCSPVLPVTKRHLAARLGMSAETLSRMLQVIAENGLHLRGRDIIINDRARIDAFCGPDPYPNRDERPLNVFAL